MHDIIKYTIIGLVFVIIFGGMALSLLAKDSESCELEKKVIKKVLGEDEIDKAAKEIEEIEIDEIMAQITNNNELQQRWKAEQE